MGVVIVLLFIIVILTVLGDFDSIFLLSFLLFNFVLLLSADS